MPPRPARQPKHEQGRGALSAEGASARRAFIEEGAAALGRTWAHGRRSDLHREGRAAAGGWPGTLHEARLLIGRDLLTAVLGGKLKTITETERELAVHAAYASARAEWLRNAEAEAP